MKRQKRIVIFILICLVVTGSFFLPPIIIAKGAPVVGVHIKSFDKPEEILINEDRNFASRLIYYTSDFEEFYVLNFRFWVKLRISELQYPIIDPQKVMLIDYSTLGLKFEDADVKEILPFLYSIKQNYRDRGRNTFGIERGDKRWYFDYNVYFGAY